MRSLLIVLFCLSLTACNSSQDNVPTDTNIPGSTSSTDPATINPAALAVEAPPTDGKLPAELIPPV